MTKLSKSKYQQLKDVIIKANPEIMELKFGCKFRSYGQTVLTFTEKIEDVRGLNRIHYGSNGYVRESQIKEIIGRPITLCDVLIAYQKFCGDRKLGGHEYISYYEANALQIVLIWNLHRNNLDEQSPETLYFLHQLLCSK